LNASDAWAVGQGDTLHWDGSAWALVPRAHTGSLQRVKIVGPNDVWAVGAGPNNTSLIEHYTALIFTDVPPTQPFYPYIQWLACRGIIGGYADGTFRPGATVTRGQLLKMVVNAAGWPLVTPPTPSFADVDASNPFYS